MILNRYRRRQFVVLCVIYMYIRRAFKKTTKKNAQNTGAIRRAGVVFGGALDKPTRGGYRASRVFFFEIFLIKLVVPE